MDEMNLHCSVGECMRAAIEPKSVLHPNVQGNIGGRWL
jgi:hypothetical protein